MSEPKPIHSLLVATDFSPAADRALAHAVAIARRQASLIRLIHVFEYFEGVPDGAGLFEPTKAEAKAASARRLEDLAENVRAGGVSVHTASLDQPVPARAIVDDAKSFGADLIVVGTRGLTGWRRLLLGSTARRVVEHAPCPVLIVHEEDPVFSASHRVVLCATDFSECARRAISRGAEMIGLGAGDSLILCHAVDIAYLAAPSQAPFNFIEYQEVLRQEAERRLTKESEDLRAAGFSCRAEVQLGEPSQRLEARARELDADLVVAGSVGRSVVAHLLLGSTAERIVSRSSCPVLIVPCHPKADADGRHAT